MAGLQRSEVSFRRQGSSGLVWDDKLLSGELKQTKDEPAQHQEKVKDVDAGNNNNAGNSKPSSRTAPSPIETLDRSRSSGGRGYRTGKVAPAIEPPSPKVSACGFCGAFGKKQQQPKNHNKAKHGKRRSR